MGRRKSWENFNKTAKNVKRSVKSLQQAADYLKDLPGEGYMKDNISKNIVKISDCKSSSLRRYVKLLDNYWYTVPLQKDKDTILAKKIEIETELNTREDGLVQ